MHKPIRVETNIVICCDLPMAPWLSQPLNARIPSEQVCGIGADRSVGGSVATACNLVRMSRLIAECECAVPVFGCSSAVELFLSDPG